MTKENNTTKKVFKSKAKGNLYENKISKELGKWMFEDQYMLGRHITSGAQKHTYVGDIVPHKRLPADFNNGKWPFLIECKNGYKNNIPNLNNQSIIRQWLSKAIDESTDDQNIIYLITAFHGYGSLLFTDVPFNLTADLILNHTERGKIIPFYMYKLKDLLDYEFISLYEGNKKLIERLTKKK